ncbi:MAG: hypothetical protein QOC80_1460 [Frankiaceae bacterium]|nr:hypothetical protein [Frankiaceae bacterium]
MAPVTPVPRPQTRSFAAPSDDDPSPRSEGALLVVTNVLSHYRVPLFQALSDELDVRFVFFSDGQEQYWRNGNSPLGGLSGKVLPGRWVGRTRIPRGLVGEITSGEHDVVVKCINGKVALPVAYLAARFSGRRFVLWTGIWQHPRARLHRLSAPLVRAIYRRADAVLTYGRHVSRYLEEQGVDPSRVRVAVQAVDLDIFRSETRAPRTPADGPAQLLYVGRLETAKGPQVLLEAVANLIERGHDVRCTFVGEGPLGPSLRQRVDQLGIAEQVRFAGRVPNPELPATYRSADVTVVPSILTDDFAEPWSLAVNEAMGCGSLVVASTAVGAVRDGLVSDGRTGLTFAWGDVGALTDALAAALTDPTRSAELAEAGRNEVQRYSYRHAAAAFVQAAELARTRGRRSARPSRTPRPLRRMAVSTKRDACR